MRKFAFCLFFQLVSDDVWGDGRIVEGNRDPPRNRAKLSLLYDKRCKYGKIAILRYYKYEKPRLWISTHANFNDKQPNWPSFVTRSSVGKGWRTKQLYFTGW